MRRFIRGVGATVAAATLIIASGCSGSEDNDSSGGGQPESITKINFVTGAAIQGREAPVYVAIDKGYFRDAGIEVNVVSGNGTEENLKLLQAGRAEFVTADITAALVDYAKGAFTDFTVVSVIQQRNLSCLVALAGSGISSPTDLAGKKIGYIPGGVVKVMFDAYAKSAGIDGSKIQWVTMPIPQQAQALASGVINVASQFVVGVGSIKAVAKRDVVVFPYSDYLTDLYGSGVAVTKATARDKPDLVRKFNTAFYKGLTYAVEHPDEAGQIYAKYQKLQPAPVATSEVAALKPYIQIAGTPIGGLQKDRVARNIAILEGAGVIPASKVHVDDIISYDLAPNS